MTDARKDELVKQITERCVKEGKLIESGWAALRIMAIPEDAPQIQIDSMRDAFFAGAQHLFGSIMSILDPSSEEPTEADLKKMDLIDRELRSFLMEYEKKHGIKP